MTRLYAGLSSTWSARMQQILQRFCQAFVDLRRRVFEGRLVPLGQNPGFKGKARRIGRNRKKGIILRHHAHPGFRLLPHDIAKDAALLINEVLLRAFNLFHNMLGNDRQRDQLSMSVLQGGARQPVRGS